MSKKKNKAIQAFRRYMRRREDSQVRNLNNKLREMNGERPCGDCTACCTVMAVQELGKPMGATCEHVCQQGCGIYSSRPRSCRVWECLWKMHPDMLDEWKPSKCGVMMEVDNSNNVGNINLTAYEVWPDAFKTMPQGLRRFLDYWRTERGPVHLCKFGLHNSSVDFKPAARYAEHAAKCQVCVEMPTAVPKLYTLEPKQQSAA